jgi:peptidoglycan hydrolase CwlO-like protein
MKKTIFIALMMIFTLGATTTFAAKNDSKSTTPVATENKLSTEELSQMKNRVEEIRKMDKSEMTVSEKRELRNESKSIKENVRKSGGVIYIGTGTLLLIILIILLV